MQDSQENVSGRSRMTGQQGEEMASDFLKKRGYKIIKRNYRTVFGELDIIAKDGETLVFVEVKMRSQDRFGAPQYSVDLKKQARVGRVALAYLSCNKTDSCACRFDVVSIVKNLQGVHVELIQNAFELSPVQ